MNTTRLRPASNGLVVPLADGSGILPPEGAPVVLNSYWRRRIADGDVVRVTDSAAADNVKRKKE